MGAARPWKRLFSSLARVGGGGVSQPIIEVQVERWGELPLLRLVGELDHHAAGGVREAVQKVLLQEESASPEGDSAGPGGGLILDMDQLSYIDSGGLALLFDIARTFEEQGQGHFLGILKPGPNVKRLLEISGLREFPTIRMILEDDQPVPATDESAT